MMTRQTTTVPQGIVYTFTGPQELVGQAASAPERPSRPAPSFVSALVTLCVLALSFGICSLVVHSLLTSAADSLGRLSPHEWLHGMTGR